MDIDSLKFQLREMQTHLQSCLEGLERGRIGADDDAALAVELGHLLDHLCLAWNTRDIPVESFGQVSDSDFAAHSNTVPNFGSSRKIGEDAF